MFPVTEDLAARSMAIPFFGDISEDQIDYVSDVIRDVLASPLSA